MSTANNHERRRTEKWRRKSAASGSLSLSPSQDSTAQKSTRGIAYKLRLRGRTFSLGTIRKLDRSCKKMRPCDGQSTRHLRAVLSLSNSQCMFHLHWAAVTFPLTTQTLTDKGGRRLTLAITWEIIVRFKRAMVNDEVVNRVSCCSRKLK